MVGAGDEDAARPWIRVVRRETALPREGEVGHVLTGENRQLLSRLRASVIDGIGEDDCSPIRARSHMEDGIVGDLDVGAAFPQRDAGRSDSHANAGDGEG